LKNKISYRTIKNDKDVLDISLLVENTGFFSKEEVSIAKELVFDCLNNNFSTYKVIIAEIKNEIVAYTCYGEIPATKGSYDLYWIAVKKEFQNIGLGRKILNETHKAIKKIKGRIVYAETSGRDQYKSTRKFYVSCNYKKVAVLKDYYQKDESKYVYQYRL
jgi:ribosomal protein S18 acetylase RimI-like enzyme